MKPCKTVALVLSRCLHVQLEVCFFESLYCFVKYHVYLSICFAKNHRTFRFWESFFKRTKLMHSVHTRYAIISQILSNIYAYVMVITDINNKCSERSSEDQSYCHSRGLLNSGATLKTKLRWRLFYFIRKAKTRICLPWTRLSVNKYHLELFQNITEVCLYLDVSVVIARLRQSLKQSVRSSRTSAATLGTGTKLGQQFNS